MSIKTEVISPEGASVKCKCGKIIFTVGKNMQIDMPYLKGKCFKCGSPFIFDKLYMNNNLLWFNRYS